MNLFLKKGDSITIIGANGSGKSTLLKVLSRNLHPRKGVVYLDGKSIFKMDTREVARQLAMVPQSPKSPGDFTVRDLVGYGRYPHLSWAGNLKHSDVKIIDWAMRVTKTEYLQHRNLHALSGGERQRAWLAMALTQKPKILLLDEPTTFLDICHQFEILELIKKLNREMGIIIVMVLHDLNQAARYSDRIFVLKNGEIYRNGSPMEVITPEVLEEVFHIKVNVYNDKVHNCPFFIPVSSIREE